MNEKQRIEAYLQSILTSVQDIQNRLEKIEDAGKQPPTGLADTLQSADSELGTARDYAYEGDVE